VHTRAAPPPSVPEMGEGEGLGTPEQIGFAIWSMHYLLYRLCRYRCAWILESWINFGLGQARCFHCSASHKSNYFFTNNITIFYSNYAKKEALSALCVCHRSHSQVFIARPVELAHCGWAGRPDVWTKRIFKNIHYSATEHKHLSLSPNVE